MTQTNTFEAGDKIRCVDVSEYNRHLLTKGKVYEVLSCGFENVRIIADDGGVWEFFPSRFELVKDEEPEAPTNNKPHKHKDLIIAWANGAEIEFFSDGTKKWYDTKTPDWVEHVQYRIKPQPKPDVVKTMFVEANPCLDNAYNSHNLKLTFCGETGKLKSAEVIS